MKKAFKLLLEARDAIEETPCSFWACDGTPENNRIRSMITCSRCRAIIYIDRSIKIFQKFGFKVKKDDNNKIQ